MASNYTLMVRSGAKVTKEEHSGLSWALDAMREAVERIQNEGELPEIKAFRTYEPGERVKARVEISRGRFLRSAAAGVDVMGDGTLVGYRGGAFKRRLRPPDGGTIYDAIRDALEETG